MNPVSLPAALPKTVDQAYIPIRSSALLLAFQLTVSFCVPLMMLLIFQESALRSGISLEIGCHGPALPFAMLPGLIFLIQLRLLSATQGNPYFTRILPSIIFIPQANRIWPFSSFPSATSTVLLSGNSALIFLEGIWT